MTRARFHDLAGRSAYQVLAVPEGSGADEINKGYRRRMRELHPDSPHRSQDPDSGDEVQQVTTAHRWLIRHRSDYDRFVNDQRMDDPYWGRTPFAPAASFPNPASASEQPRRRAAPGTGTLRMPGAPATGSFRTAGREQMAERAAEWAERQRREQWKSGEDAEPRSAWKSSPVPEAASGEQGKRGQRARSAWEPSPSPERQMWDASREEVSRRREERRLADERRREAARVSESGSPATETVFAETSTADSKAGGDSADAGHPVTGSGARTAGAPSFAGSAKSAPSRKGKRRIKIRWPRLGLPKLPPIGLPQAPRVGLPVLPRVGVPRLGVRVLPRRRARAGLRIDSVLLAVFIIVLGFMAASRLPL